MPSYTYEMEVRRRRVLTANDAPRAIVSSKDVAAYLADMATLPTERMTVILLDARNRIIGRCDVAIGGVGACYVSPTDVFRPAVVQGAASIIVAHNHPSGECAPSSEDIALTNRLCSAAQILGVSLLDHVILGEGCHYSFLDSGMLNTGGRS